MKNDAMLAVELLEVIEARRKLDRREEELKGYFRTRLTNLNVDTVTVGGVLISLVEKSRSSLDRKALTASFGEDVIKRFERLTQYLQLDVKQINSAIGKRAA